jgi:hypothetical protein
LDGVVGGGGGGGRVLVEIFTCFSVHWAAFDTLGLEKR